MNGCQHKRHRELMHPAFKRSRIKKAAVACSSRRGNSAEIFMDEELEQHRQVVCRPARRGKADCFRSKSSTKASTAQTGLSSAIF
jgi:hypothetical protein